LFALIKKFGTGNSVDAEIQALQLRYKNSSEAIADLEGRDARLQELEKELTAVKKTLLAEAKKVSGARVEAAQNLSTLVTQEIQQLSMPNATFVAQVQSADYSAPKESDFTSHGCDEISMFIQDIKMHHSFHWQRVHQAERCRGDVGP
jgi:DNA repair ATPase RecN